MSVSQGAANVVEQCRPHYVSRVLWRRAGLSTEENVYIPSHLEGPKQ